MFSEHIKQLFIRANYSLKNSVSVPWPVMSCFFFFGPLLTRGGAGRLAWGWFSASTCFLLLPFFGDALPLTVPLRPLGALLGRSPAFPGRGTPGSWPRTGPDARPAAGRKGGRKGY